jgi:hypothetical protein
MIANDFIGNAGRKPREKQACDFYMTSAADSPRHQMEALTSACAVNRSAGRRKPGAYSGPEAAGGNSVRAVQGGAVDERGSSVGQLRGRARRQRAAAPRHSLWPSAGRDSADGYPGLARRPVAAAGTVPRVIPVSC